MKKKLLGSTFVAATALILVACGGGDDNESGNGNGDSGNGDSENTAEGYVPEDLTVQFVPSQNAETLDVIAEPLEEMLEERLDIPVTVNVSSDYNGVVAAMGSGSVDVGFLPPNAYVEAEAQGYAEVILQSQRFGVNEEDGSETEDLVDSYKAQFVVRADSDIETLDDLVGKNIGFQNTTSSAGYVWPVGLLMDNGIDVTDVNNVPMQGHDAAIIALLAEDVDAAATFQDARNTVVGDFPTVFEDTRILEVTEDIPNDTISVHADMNDEWKQKIADAFIDIGQTEEGGQIIYDVYSHRGYAPSQDSNFDIVREYAEKIQDQ